MFELFLLGSFGFWILVAIEFLVLLACLEFENHVLSTISLIAVGLLLYYFGDGSKIFEAIITHPWHIFPIAFGYIVIGVVWAMVKWWLFIHKTKYRYKEKLNAFVEGLQSDKRQTERDIQYIKNEDRIDEKTRLEQRLNEIEQSISTGKITGDYLQNRWDNMRTAIYYDKYNRPYSIQKPVASAYKSRIISWIAYWPPSVIWTAINDPVRNAAHYAYILVVDLFNKISDSVWADVA